MNLHRRAHLPSFRTNVCNIFQNTTYFRAFYYFSHQYYSLPSLEKTIHFVRKIPFPAFQIPCKTSFILLVYFFLPASEFDPIRLKSLILNLLVPICSRHSFCWFISRISQTNFCRKPSLFLFVYSLSDTKKRGLKCFRPRFSPVGQLHVVFLQQLVDSFYEHVVET